MHEFGETESRLKAAKLPTLGEDQRRELANLHAARGEIRCLTTPWAGKKNWNLWRKAEDGTPSGLLGFLAAATNDLPAGCKAILKAFRMRVW